MKYSFMLYSDTSNECTTVGQKGRLLAYISGSLILTLKRPLDIYFYCYPSTLLHNVAPTTTEMFIVSRDEPVNRSLCPVSAAMDSQMFHLSDVIYDLR
jgi:hypothetical protein